MLAQTADPAAVAKSTTPNSKLRKASAAQK
jgi:hypothetical protein